MLALPGSWRISERPLTRIHRVDTAETVVERELANSGLPALGVPPLPLKEDLRTVIFDAKGMQGIVEVAQRQGKTWVTSLPQVELNAKFAGRLGCNTLGLDSSEWLGFAGLLVDGKSPLLSAHERIESASRINSVSGITSRVVYQAYVNDGSPSSYWQGGLSRTYFSVRGAVATGNANPTLTDPQLRAYLRSIAKTAIEHQALNVGSVRSDIVYVGFADEPGFDLQQQTSNDNALPALNLKDPATTPPSLIVFADRMWDTIKAAFLAEYVIPNWLDNRPALAALGRQWCHQLRFLSNDLARGAGEVAESFTEEINNDTSPTRHVPRSANWNNLGYWAFRLKVKTDSHLHDILAPSWFDLAEYGVDLNVILAAPNQSSYFVSLARSALEARPSPKQPRMTATLYSTPRHARWQGSMVRQVLPALAAGVRDFAYWGYGPTPFFAHTPTTDPLILREIRTTNDVLTRLVPLLKDSQLRRAKVAILLPSVSRIWDVSSADPAYTDETIELFRLLRACGHAVDIIDDRDNRPDQTGPATFLGVTPRYDTIFVVGPNLCETIASQLADWTHNGGHLDD